MRHEATTFATFGWDQDELRVQITGGEYQTNLVSFKGTSVLNESYPRQRGGSVSFGARWLTKCKSVWGFEN
jgi:hypothetical protein